MLANSADNTPVLDMLWPMLMKGQHKEEWAIRFLRDLGMYQYCWILIGRRLVFQFLSMRCKTGVLWDFRCGSIKAGEFYWCRGRVSAQCGTMRAILGWSVARIEKRTLYWNSWICFHLEVKERNSFFNEKKMERETDRGVKTQHLYREKEEGDKEKSRTEDMNWWTFIPFRYWLLRGKLRNRGSGFYKSTAWLKTKKKKKKKKKKKREEEIEVENIKR